MLKGFGTAAVYQTMSTQVIPAGYQPGCKDGKLRTGSHHMEDYCCHMTMLKFKSTKNKQSSKLSSLVAAATFQVLSVVSILDGTEKEYS